VKQARIGVFWWRHAKQAGLQQNFPAEQSIHQPAEHSPRSFSSTVNSVNSVNTSNSNLWFLPYSIQEIQTSQSFKNLHQQSLKQYPWQHPWQQQINTNLTRTPV
jgi:hypothetical protein